MVTYIMFVSMKVLNYAGNSIGLASKPDDSQSAAPIVLRPKSKPAHLACVKRRNSTHLLAIQSTT